MAITQKRKKMGKNNVGLWKEPVYAIKGDKMGKYTCSNCLSTTSKEQHEGWPIGRWHVWIEPRVPKVAPLMHHYCSIECYHAHAKSWTIERTCAACGYTHTKSKYQDWNWPTLSGKDYCSPECYDTLFAECQECHRETMCALANTKPHWGNYLPQEQLCSTCYDKKHNLVSVWLRWG